MAYKPTTISTLSTDLVFLGQIVAIVAVSIILFGSIALSTKLKNDALHERVDVLESNYAKELNKVIMMREQIKILSSKIK